MKFVVPPKGKVIEKVKDEEEAEDEAVRKELLEVFTRLANGENASIVSECITAIMIVKLTFECFNSNLNQIVFESVTVTFVSDNLN